jgi:GNAT superfamily N-acetyltransferase
LNDFEKIKYIRDYNNNLWIMDIRYGSNLLEKKFDIICRNRPTSFNRESGRKHLLLTSADLSNKYCWVDDIFVREEFRGLGIGSWMLAEALGFWRNQGITSIRGKPAPNSEVFWIKRNAIMDASSFTITDFSDLRPANRTSEISRAEFSMQITLTKAHIELEECQKKLQNTAKLLDELRNKSVWVRFYEVIRDIIIYALFILSFPIALISKIPQAIISLIVSLFNKFKKKGSQGVFYN